MGKITVCTFVRTLFMLNLINKCYFHRIILANNTENVVMILKKIILQNHLLCEMNLIFYKIDININKIIVKLMGSCLL